MNQTINQRQALTAYSVALASKRHDMRAAEAEFRRTTDRPLPAPQAVRHRPAIVVVLDAITWLCEKLVDHSWWLLAAIPLAALLLHGRAAGGFQ